MGQFGSVAKNRGVNSNSRLEIGGTLAKTKTQSQLGGMIEKKSFQVLNEVMEGDLLKANTEYNQKMSEVTNELRQRKLGGAKNLTQEYDEKERKIKSEIMGSLPNFSKIRNAFGTMASKDNSAARGSLSSYELGQLEQYKETELSNSLSSAGKTAVSSYNDDDIFKDKINKGNELIAHSMSKYGPAVVKEKQDKFLGQVYQSSIGAAMANRNYEKAGELLTRGESVLNPDTVNRYTSNLVNYYAGETKAALVDSLSDKYGANVNAAMAELRMSGGFSLPKQIKDGERINFNEGDYDEIERGINAKAARVRAANRKSSDATTTAFSDELFALKSQNVTEVSQYDALALKYSDGTAKGYLKNRNLAMGIANSTGQQNQDTTRSRNDFNSYESVVSLISENSFENKSEFYEFLQNNGFSSSDLQKYGKIYDDSQNQEGMFSYDRAAVKKAVFLGEENSIYSKQAWVAADKVIAGKIAEYRKENNGNAPAFNDIVAWGREVAVNSVDYGVTVDDDLKVERSWNNLYLDDDEKGIVDVKATTAQLINAGISKVTKDGDKFNVQYLDGDSGIMDINKLYSLINGKTTRSQEK